MLLKIVKMLSLGSKTKTKAKNPTTLHPTHKITQTTEGLISFWLSGLFIDSGDSNDNKQTSGAASLTHVTVLPPGLRPLLCLGWHLWHKEKQGKVLCNILEHISVERFLLRVICSYWAWSFQTAPQHGCPKGGYPSDNTDLHWLVMPPQILFLWLWLLMASLVPALIFLLLLVGLTCSAMKSTNCNFN